MVALNPWVVSDVTKIASGLGVHDFVYMQGVPCPSIAQKQTTRSNGLQVQHIMVVSQVPEAHEAARGAARAAAERQRDDHKDRLPGMGGAGAGPQAAHWLAGAVRRPRGGLTYAPQEAADK